MSNLDLTQLVTAADKAARSEARARAGAAAEACAYLVETDWYVIRSAETGLPVPEEVAARRAAARQAIGGI